MINKDPVILVVDDNEDNRYVLTERLKREGYECIDVAENGQEALDKLRSKNFDLVLLDIMMPEMDGYEVCKRLKADPRTRDIPVIFLTAKSEIEDETHGLELGAVDYITKPISPPIVLARVKTHLAMKAVQDFLRDQNAFLEAEVKKRTAEAKQAIAEAAKTHGEMEAAMCFQMSLLPDAEALFKNEGRLDIAARMEPAKMVGGDLYDCFMLDEHRVFFSVGDVCGKGVPASLFMVISKTLCKSVALRDDMQDMNLGRLMRRANLEISRENHDMSFATAFVGVLDLRNGELTYCNAGHDRPLLFTPGSRPKELEGAGGPPISLVKDFEYETHQYRLSSEEFLCLFTDGATEAFNPAQLEYGTDGLTAALADIRHDADAHEIMEKICSSVHTFTAGAEQSDDLTVMIIRWKGGQEINSAG